MTWKPIDTAPKDRLVLLTPGDCATSGFLKAVKVGGWIDEIDAWEIFGASWTPTYWMELPEPPSSLN